MNFILGFLVACFFIVTIGIYLIEKYENKPVEDEIEERRR